MQIAELSAGQLQSLTTAQISVVQGNQVASLSNDQLRGLNGSQVQALSIYQLPALTSSQISQGFTASQIASLTTSQISALKGTEVAALSADQLMNLQSQQIEVLSNDQISHFTGDQAQNLATSQLDLFSATQIQALAAGAVAALHDTQIESFTTVQIQSLSGTQMASLSVAQLSALSTMDTSVLLDNQLASLSTTQVQGLSGPQRASLTTLQASFLNQGTPIVLDLSGKGISTESIGAGVKFDIFGTGQDTSTGWVTPSDGLLVMDRNHDGSITGEELFGSGTTLSNGQKATNGYQALGQLDTNGDGMINAKDANWSQLEVWVDGNGDGVSQASELRSLDSLGITQLNLNAKTSTTIDHGNLIGLVSSYQISDGATHEMADVTFTTGVSAQQAYANAAPAPVSAPSQSWVNSLSFPTSASQPLSSAVAPTVSKIAPQPAPAAAPPSLNAPQTALSSQVVDMANALNSFTRAQSAASVAVASLLTPTPSSSIAGGLAVTHMVSAMSQYDANGCPLLGSAVGQTGALQPVLRTTVPEISNAYVIAIQK